MIGDIWFAAAFWVGSHLLVSSTGLRGLLVRLVGEKVYLALYSVLAAFALVNLIMVYNGSPRFDYLWMPDPDLYWVTKICMPLAFILLVGGFMVRNPTNVGMSIDDPEDASRMATGVTRITRHPLQWAVILWATSHMVANGDLVSLAFFGSFLLLSLLGSFLMDAKKAATMGAGWQAYAAVTSNVPFVAVLSGRTGFPLKEFIAPVIAGLVVHGLVYYFHEAITGAVII